MILTALFKYTVLQLERLEQCHLGTILQPLVRIKKKHTLMEFQLGLKQIIRALQ